MYTRSNTRKSHNIRIVSVDKDKFQRAVLFIAVFAETQLNKEA